MNKTLFCALLAAPLCISACAPLSQAGLLYSSRSQVGLNLAGGTAETPGFAVNIGMNVNDMAYIPVVVGRPCESARNANCDQTLIQVRGNNDVGSYQSSDDQDGETAHIPAQLPANSGSGTKAAQDLVAPVEAVNQAAQIAENAAADARESAARVLRAEKINNRSSNNRYDALSVYGTFDSSAAAAPGGANATPNASLRLGRIFSTGVASQNLTDGERGAAQIRAYTQCMESVITTTEGLPDNEARKTLRQQLLSACAGAPR